MAATLKKRILIADSDLFSTATLLGALKDDYYLECVATCRDLYIKIAQGSYDLLVLETKLQDGNGFEICQKLKQNPDLGELPIIFVASTTTTIAEARCFEAGAADFIAKPINAPILKARIRNQIHLSSAIRELRQLHQLALDANPKTGLPGNNSIFHELGQAITRGAQASVIYADLDNFKIYNDLYGFARGDDVILFTANVLRVALQQCCSGEGFIGHIGGDDFVLIVPADRCKLLADEIIRRIDSGIKAFYREEDISRGHVVATDREGVEKCYPLISLSMGAVDLTRRKLTSPLEVVDICTETKKAAKLRQGSTIYLDQRCGN